MTKRTAVRTTCRAVATGAVATALIGLAPHPAPAAAPAPAPRVPARASLTAARAAAGAPATLDRLARYFDGERRRGGAGAAGAAQAAPRLVGGTVPVYGLSPDFVHGRSAAPVARLEFLATKAVAADGRTASVWTAERGGAWKVVTITGGDEEARYAAPMAARDQGGTVFREPRIDAWYVQHGDRIEPLDADARAAVGAHGTTVAAYRTRVAKAYGAKAAGSAYRKRAGDGGHGRHATGWHHHRAPLEATALAGDSFPVAAASTVAAAAALLALGLSAGVALRRRYSR
ncbi:hypothetical protein AB0O20_07040 [Streptomyces kronopolitis]|uniref:hypothetical protein n=1 Tax=Streptomyces kronopolitis TaxID=1612435 RepID=UPI003437F800